MDLIPSFFDERNRIWSGAKQSRIYNTECSAGMIIYTMMKNWPKNICQINDVDGVKVTNAEALVWSIRIAQHFKARRFTHEQVIGISAKNSTYLMPVVAGCMMNCTPFHAVNSVLDDAALKLVYGITKPVVIFCDGSSYEKIKEATKAWKPEIITLTDHIEGVPKIEDWLAPTKTEMFYQPQPLTFGGDQTVAILCSSGTTGPPKAVCVSNKYVLLENKMVNSESILFTGSGFDWITGLAAFMFCSLIGCTRIVTTKLLTAEYFVELVKKYQISYALLAARHVSEIANSPKATTENLSSLRFLNYGGGLITEMTFQKLQKICKGLFITTGYAMTEVGLISINIGMVNSNCVGKLVTGIRMRIVDDDGKNLGYNETGEIYVHNGSEWSGYYGNPMESQRMQDHHGWIHTGDIGYFDEKNFLYFVDRKKEILKYLGVHYWPTEIENAIGEMPQVAEVCVVGIYDETVGDRAGALVVKRKGSSLSASDVEEFVKKSFTVEHKRLHAGVRFVDKLPMNVNGKVIKELAKELLLSEQNGIKIDK